MRLIIKHLNAKCYSQKCDRRHSCSPDMIVSQMKAFTMASSELC